MPSFIGSFKINSVGPSSNVNNGDTAFIILSSSAKVNAGSASFSPGDTFFSPTFHTNESTDTNEPSLVNGAIGRIV
ncbi:MULTISPECIES: spore germination protein [Paenibacillus]|uniref:Spore germination protein n=1 Tax=Paenibacillus radicis (ex Xue et al. 2023) TaxID=2972489 RepID=A0ABT1YQP8_9BACL|nr:spore germination protein [Paenibacillus radicis (ex Xue et al. 2023)]MCR8634603.1 spore germination protein [Paenibacillus radicis (ex Xue et al. 2023)]